MASAVTAQAIVAEKSLPNGSAACTECQRRKQKCNREWPCDRCHKRKVPEQCRFQSDHPAADAWSVSRKRELTEDSLDLSDDGEGLEAIGYGVDHLLGRVVESKTKRLMGKQYFMDPKTSRQLRRALDCLPPKDYIDTLVRNFLDNVNFYYYIIYPPTFLSEYSEWWRNREAGRPLGAPWTCLLIMICACSVQHATTDLARKLMSDLRMDVKQLADVYNDAARELHSAIPLGHSHFYTVQYLLHSCYWYKAEAQFVECWHLLGSAVREAQMLGLHQDSSNVAMSDFDKEMARRLWCIVDAWDWLVSALLQRPMLIDRADCEAQQPSLTLEPYPTSPLLHIRLQSVLVQRIFKRFGPPKNIQTMADIKDYTDILETWMEEFPPEFHFENPDTSHEAEYPWIALHRHYLHTTALSMSLGPLRSFMVKEITQTETPTIEVNFRSDGVHYALGLMGAVHRFFEYVWTRDSTFHFVPFCIFDTAALLCSAIMHDKDGTIPRRQEILSAIELALDSLKRLSTATNTAKTPFVILRRLAAKGIPQIQLDGSPSASRKRAKFGELQQPVAIPATFPDVNFGTNGMMHTTTSNDYSLGGSNEAVPAVFDSSSQSFGGSYSGSYTTQSPPSDHSINGGASLGVPVGDYIGQVPVVTSSDGEFALSAENGFVLPSTYADVRPLSAMMPTQMINQEVGQTLPAGARIGDLAELWNWQSLDLEFTENPMLWASNGHES